jgi:polyisoprenyl-phosphate glycosyltransferase
MLRRRLPWSSRNPCFEGGPAIETLRLVAPRFRGWVTLVTANPVSGRKHASPLDAIVVAGACGFIGANLCRHFAAQGAKVWAIDGPSGNDWRLRGVPGLKRIKLDLCSRKSVDEFILSEQPSVVINCAAYGAYPNQKDADQIYAVNFDGVRFLLEAVRKVPEFVAFIQAGTSSEYGMNCAGPTEDGVTLPDSDYAVSKVAATALVRLYGLKHGVPAWVLRLYSVYGPYEDFSRLLPTLLLSAKEKRFPKLVNPSISRDFVFIDDICKAFGAVIARAPSLKRGTVFNIGSGTRTSLADLVSLAQNVFDIPGQPVWGSMPNRHWDHSDWFSNPTRANSELSWQAGTSLRDGLSATMRWLEDNASVVVDGQKSSVIHSSTP